MSTYLNMYIYSIHPTKSSTAPASSYACLSHSLPKLLYIFLMQMYRYLICLPVQLHLNIHEHSQLLSCLKYESICAVCIDISNCIHMVSLASPFTTAPASLHTYLALSLPKSASKSYVSSVAAVSSCDTLYLHLHCITLPA